MKMKSLFLITGLLFCCLGNAQELFTFTEPASNMAAKSVGFRLNNFIMKDAHTTKTKYQAIPEVMVGVSRKIMVHMDAFLSNRNKGFAAEGGGIYAKYRFISNDDVQKHFRMAAYTRYSFNNGSIHQEEINLNGFNSGFELGVVATQLLHKVALSSGVSLLKATNNGAGNKYPYGSDNSKAIYYTLSAGKLMLPRTYTDYKQTNMNVMLELLNQYNTGSGKYYIDVAPSVQFIFNSVARVDVGYRKQLSGTLSRTAQSGLFIRLEYNFFNAF
jgi:hypothetical protein